MKERTKVLFAGLGALVLLTGVLTAQMKPGRGKGMNVGTMNGGMMGYGMMNGMSGRGMMNGMQGMNMQLYRYLGLNNDMQKMMLDMQQAMLDTRKQMLPLMNKMQKISLEINTLKQTALTNKADAAKLLNLLKQSESLHQQMFKIRQTRMKTMVRTKEDHMKNLNNKVQAWIKKAQKNPEELKKFIEFLNTMPNGGNMNMMNMMNGSNKNMMQNNSK